MTESEVLELYDPKTVMLEKRVLRSTGRNTVGNTAQQTVARNSWEKFWHSKVHNTLSSSSRSRTKRHASFQYTEACVDDEAPKEVIEEELVRVIEELSSQKEKKQHSMLSLPDTTRKWKKTRKYNGIEPQKQSGRNPDEELHSQKHPLQHVPREREREREISREKAREMWIVI